VVWLTGFFVLTTFLLPTALLCSFYSAFRKRFFFFFPLGVSFLVAAVGLLSVATYSFIPFGWGKYASVVGAGVLLQYFYLRLLSRFTVFKEKHFFNAKVIGLLLFAALFVSLDNGFIFQKQGFSDEPGKTYFRPPMHDDMQRHVIVTNALIRHEGSPLLAGQRFLYQLTWHHLTAVFVSLLPYENTRYPLVAGMALATGFLFAFIILWAIVLLRPAWAFRSISLFMLLLVFSHVDIYHFLSSVFYTGKWGIEADWSYAVSPYLRYFSPKLIMLTAPQHAVFFLLLTVFLIFDNSYGFRQVRTNTFSFLAFVSLFIFSPLVAGFFFLIYWSAKGVVVVKKRSGVLPLLTLAVVSIVVGCFLHRALFGFWPHELMMRPGTSSLVFFNHEWEEISQLLFSPLGIAGIVGLFVCALFAHSRRRTEWPFIVFFGGIATFYFVVTDVEIRRHFSMVAAFAAVFAIALGLPSHAWYRKFSPRRRLLLSTLALAAAFHGYYLYSYLGKPSVIDPNISWKDYFALNRILESQYPRMPVIGAVDPQGIGNVYPIAMQVTPSFSMPNHAVIHSYVTQEKFNVLRKIMSSGDVAPFATSLGYHAIVWGPVEEKLWGNRVERRFIDDKELLATSGSVKLYRLRDKLQQQLNPEARETAEFYYKAAHLHAESKWFQEALGYYYRALELDPNHWKANQEIGKVLDFFGRKDEAKNFYRRVEEPVP
jgi:hypothetical protein